MSGERFRHQPMDFVAVPHERYVYVGIADRAAFDKIASPCLDSGENDAGHVLVKTVQHPEGVTVIFQHWIKSLTPEAIIADAKARREREASGAAS